MVSLQIVFLVAIILSALVGMVRGWQKEVMTMTGLIFSIAVLHFTGFAMVELLGWRSIELQVVRTQNEAGVVQLETAYTESASPYPCTSIPQDAYTELLGVTPALDPNLIAHRSEFYVQAIFHSLIAIFSYHVGRSGQNTETGARAARVRSVVERGLLGLGIGSVNGYLLFGTLWGFLEYRLTPSGYIRLNQACQYAFYPDVQRPFEDSAVRVIQSLPQAETFGLGMWMVIFFVAVFFVVIARY